MLLTIYSLGHFAVDLVCAFLVLGAWNTAGPGNTPEHAVLILLLYNYCAFALQMPVGILCDRLGRCRLFSAGGALLVLLAFLPGGIWYRTIFAGIGNAFYHVGGGREILLREKGYHSLGIFVAPGAVGLFLGSALRTENVVGLFGASLLAFAGILLFLLSREERPSPTRIELPDRKSVIRLVLLFLVVFLRSFLGLCMRTPWKTGAWIPVGAVLGALGKALGGFSADRFGGKMTGEVSLFLAAFLFLFPEAPLCGIFGGLLFNMSMPLTLKDSADLLKGGEGFVFGLMTFALFLGFLPVTLDVSLSPSSAAFLSVLSGLLLLLCAERRA